MRRKLYLIILTLIILTFSTPSYAYLDPGTGSALLQGLLAGVAGVLGIVKIYWQRLKGFIKKKLPFLNKANSANIQEKQEHDKA